MLTPSTENMRPTRESTGVEALESVVEAVESTVLTHWEVGQKIQKEETKQMHEWTMEVVKHLAIINVAGLAGSVTLIAAQMSKEVNRSYFVYAAVFFLSGLILAVLDMYMNSFGYYKRMEEIQKRIKELRRLYKDSPIKLLKYLKENAIEAPYNDECWFYTAGFLGGFSFVAFFVGVINIYLALKPLIK